MRQNSTVRELIKRDNSLALPLFTSELRKTVNHAIAEVAPRKIETAKDTRDESYKLIVENLLPNLRKLFDAILLLQPCTDLELQAYLGWTLNRIPARRNDLMEVGLVQKGGRMWNHDTKRHNALWQIVQGAQ